MDNCDILTHSEDEMLRFINRLAYRCEAFGLEINLKKTVVMHDPVPRFPNIKPTIYVEEAKASRGVLFGKS